MHQIKCGILHLHGNNINIHLVAQVQVNSFDYTKESLEPIVNQSTDEMTRLLCQNIKAYLYIDQANPAHIFKENLPVYCKTLEAEKQKF